MNVVITGGTGFIGSALVRRLHASHHSVVILSRHRESTHGSPPAVELWDGKTSGSWQRCIDGADAVLNFTGESLATKRWTPAQKERLLRSRLDPTAALVSALERAPRKSRVFISASAVGFYGDVEKDEVTEARGSGSGFLAELCRHWEEAAHRAASFGIRVVTPRLGVVLGRGGGALQKMLTPFKLFAGGPLGTGRQWFPWVHIDDVVSAALFALDSPQLSGAVNLVAPESVTMRQFCSTLAAVLHRPSWMPVPAIALRIALGEMSEMLLTGQRVVPARLLNAGYPFRFPKLAAALAAVLDRPVGDAAVASPH